MLKGSVIATVVLFGGSKSLDNNGKPSYMLRITAGKYPLNRTVLTGSVAENLGLELHKTYLMNFQENGDDLEFGKRITWLNQGELKGVEIIKAEQAIGESEPFEVETKRPDGYVNKMQRIEGQTAIRAGKGLFKPLTLGSNTPGTEAPAATVQTRQPAGSVPGKTGN